MSELVTGESLAPHAFELEGTGEDGLEYDLGNLAAFDTQPVDASTLASGREGTLLAMATSATQLLIRHLFTLPVEQSEAGPLAVLPPPSTSLPREKHVPVDSPPTRWEKFAKEKGITKKKRERMLWDETKKEWKPRYGFGKANDASAAWAIPVHGNADPMADPYQVLADDKKKRTIKNKLSMLKNMTTAGNANAESKEMKAARLAVASISTASMGKFDKRLAGASPKEQPKELPGAKKRPLPNEQHGDKARDLDVIRRVLEGSVPDKPRNHSNAPGSGKKKGKGGKGGKAGKIGKIVSRQAAKKARKK